MNKTKLALAIGALTLAAGQSALAAEFTVSGTIDYSYYYYNSTLGGVDQGDRYEVTVTYADNPGTPDYSNTYTSYDYYYYQYGYTQTQSEWYNTIQSIEVVVYNTDNSIAHAQTVTMGAEGVTYSHNAAGSYTVDYATYYNDYEQVYFNVQNQVSNGQVTEYQNVQLYFWGYQLDLVVDHSQFPQPPDQAMLDSGQVQGQLWTHDYHYNSSTGAWEEFYYGGRVTHASGVIVTNPDSDGDGVSDDEDAFPNDPAESVDSDGDGVGNNGDAFPNDATETADSDGDGVGNNADVFPNDATETADADGDGVGNNADQNDSSDLSATVVIDGNNSGVANGLVSNGLTLADLINAAATECKATAKNHGAYTSCVGKTLNALKAAGTITEAQKEALQAAVAKSSFGKK